MKTIGLDQFESPNLKGGIKLDTHFLKQNCIRVVIQEMPTGRYWECEGLWTSDFQEATRFATCTAALEQANHLKLQNVQLVITRESEACGIIPLTATA